MKPHIEIRIQLGEFPSSQDVSIALPLEDYFLREASASLDFPRRGTDAMTEAIFCTPRVTRAAVRDARNALADAAARRVREKMIELLGNKDTENGYKRERS